MRATDPWRRLLFLLRRRRLNEELEEEMRLHMELRAKKLQEGGLDLQKAAYVAERQFGNKTLLKEVSREMWGWISVERFLQDLRFGLRMLRKNATFSTVAILTLALGIGANTAIFSLVDHVILRPLTFRDPDRLYALHEHLSGMFTKMPPLIPVNAMHFTEWRKNLKSFDELALIGGFSENLTGTGQPQRLHGARVS